MGQAWLAEALGKYRLPITALMLVLAISAMFFAYYEHRARNEREHKALAEELQDFILPPIFNNGEAATKTSSLNTLRAARYGVETRIDPIFGTSGVDPSKLKGSLREMKIVTGEVLKKFGSKYQGTVADALYPEGFLSKLPDLELLRREIVERPNETTIHNYDLALREAIHAYALDLQSYKQALTALSDEERSADLYYPSGLTTVNTVIEKLEKLEMMARNADQKRERRRRCFDGATNLCTPLADSFQQLFKDKEKNVSVDASPLTTLSETFELRDITRARSLDEKNASSYQERLVELAGSPCVPTERPVYYYVLEKNNKNGLRSIAIAPLYDILFYDLRLEETQKSPYFMRLRAQGLTYTYQNAGNLYYCADAGSVLTRILALTSIGGDIRAQPLFNSTTTPASFEVLRTLESRVVREQIPSELTLSKYLDEVRRVFREQGEQGLANIVGSETVLRAENLLHEWDEKTARYETAVAGAVEISKKGFKEGVLEIKPPLFNRFLVSRTYPSLFFMPFNTSITSDFVSFFQRNEPVALSGFSMVSYYSELKEALGYDGVMNVIKDDLKVRPFYDQ